MGRPALGAAATSCVRLQFHDWQFVQGVVVCNVSKRTSSMDSSGWKAVVAGSMIKARLIASTTPSVAAHLNSSAGHTIRLLVGLQTALAEFLLPESSRTKSQITCLGLRQKTMFRARIWRQTRRCPSTYKLGKIRQSYQTSVLPPRRRSSSWSSTRAAPSSSAAKLPAMKATKRAPCDSSGDGNCAMYFSAASWLAFSL